jgi:predicted signal transduction protein with EAL and GGDEF domain
LAEPIHADDAVIMVGASIGIAMAGGPDETASGLIRRADLAMYQAKRHDKAKVQMFCSEDEMTDASTTT